jgi:Zn-dependent protease
VILYGASGAAPSQETPTAPRRSLAVVALAGPLATFALAALWWLPAHQVGPSAAAPVDAVVRCLDAAELLQGLRNLVPVGPLDGALALRSLRAG